MPHYSPNMGSREYWLERLFDRDAAARIEEDRLINQLNSLYRQSFRDIKRELNNWYNTYAVNNSLTFQEAQRLLSPIEVRQYQEHMAILKRIYNESHNPFILEQIKRLQDRAYITRQMALLDSIDKILIETANNVQITLEDHLINMYQREHRAALEALGITDFPVTPVNAIKEIIQYPYAGAMFSDRIWRNKNQLLNYINDDLTKHLIKGSSIQAMSKDLMQRCNVLYYQAERLVRTETNYAMTQGHKNGYKDAGLTEFEFSAHIDGRTSPQCRAIDGQVFLIDESVVGTNTPPMHPNCRSTILPVIPETFIPETIKEPDELPEKTDTIKDNSSLEFKTKQAATDYAINELGFQKINWGRKLTQEMINDTIDTLDKVFKRYPALKGSMKEIKTDSGMGRAIAAVSYNGELKLSTTNFYKQKKDRRIHTIYHESSHMLERLIDWNKYAPMVVDSAFNRLGYTPAEAAKAVRKISNYATTNKAECMAEAFAEAMTEGNNATDLSKEILKILDKEFKK